jgi:RimJ/RimL family protein N-acetyltransferase
VTSLMQIEPVTLAGRHVRLEPLDDTHFEGLAAIAFDDALWRLQMSPMRDREDLRQYVAVARADQLRGSALPFATIDQASGRVIGSTRFANIERTHRRVEIGWTWIARPWQRTAANTEAKRLMLTHAFETWGCVRVELKTDVLNEQSRRAMLRIGAREEGILRSHMQAWNGRRRDTIYFSILDHEWPEVRAGLADKLAPPPEPD